MFSTSLIAINSALYLLPGYRIQTHKKRTFKKRKLETFLVFHYSMAFYTYAYILYIVFARLFFAAYSSIFEHRTLKVGKVEEYYL